MDLAVLSAETLLVNVFFVKRRGTPLGGATVLAAVLRVDSTGWQPNASTALAAALPTSTLFDLSRTHHGLWD